MKVAKSTVEDVRFTYFIEASFVRAANADEGTNRTKIMYKSYLSFSQLKEYLRTLQENGLIDYEGERRCYRITERGIRVLKLQNKMEEIAPIN